jgi:ribonuclease HII
MPHFELEESVKRRRGPSSLIAGIDEAGRGPLAGPVVAGAVIFEGALPADLEGIDDSKTLAADVRETLCAAIRKTAAVGIGVASVREIDRLNILNATFLAMKRALRNLGRKADHALIDGNRVPSRLGVPADPVIGGDGQSLSIAAASIVAKVTRDAMMRELAVKHPQYGWHTNMGYGTPEHLDALAAHGVTQHHRRSFAPVHKMLCQELPLTL